MMSIPTATPPTAPPDVATTVPPASPGWRNTLEESLLPPIVALLVALVVGDVLILLFGQSPAAVYRLLLEGTWGNAYGIGQVLYKTTTLTFTGLAVAVGIRAGLFNIGAEGQLAAGGFLAALVGLMIPDATPGIVAILLCTIGAAAGGGAGGAGPGGLRAGGGERGGGRGLRRE